MGSLCRWQQRLLPRVSRIKQRFYYAYILRRYNMKIENDYYIVVKEENNKTMYLTTNDTFTEDIYESAKAINKVTALALIDAYKETKYFNKEISKEDYENSDYNLGLKIIPLRITYIW